MSQSPSDCVPYRPQLGGRRGPERQRATPNDDGGYQHGHHSRERDRGSMASTTSQTSEQEPAERLKLQPKDKFHRNEDDDYFASVQDDDEPSDINRRTSEPEDEEDDDDPLDAYMKSIESEAGKKDAKARVADDESPQTCSKVVASPNRQGTKETERAKGVRLDIDESDDTDESYLKFLEDKKNQSDNQDADERQNSIEYDKDGNVIGVRKIKREVEPLPPLDHSTINYPEFDKNFYFEDDTISLLTPEFTEKIRERLQIRVSGNLPPRPVCSFSQFHFDPRLMKVIEKSEYCMPTPIQAQAIPAALQGRNLIGIAMTGSGKTAAYLWPMIVHIMNQPGRKQSGGPIGLVLVPTRELALQVYGEAQKVSKSHKLRVICAYGGGSKYEQSRDLESGAHIVVATPGRMIDLIKGGVTNLRRVTYLVLDEADRFFEMGFEAQVRSICDHIRPDRQTLLFSATFKHRVEQLARTVIDDPIKIVHKTVGEVNEDITQHFIIFQDTAEKWKWLMSRLADFSSTGSVLIFVTRIADSEELHKRLGDTGEESLLLHGDMEQYERNRVITAFKRRDCSVMIATDVAARGLDIPSIRTVINYDVARDIDTHVHRVGRTGRAGSKGDAYTLLNADKDKEFAGHLVKNLEVANEAVGQDLMNLAMRSHAFRKSRERHDRRAGTSNRHSHQHKHRSNYHDEIQSSMSDRKEPRTHSSAHSSWIERSHYRSTASDSSRSRSPVQHHDRTNH